MTNLILTINQHLYHTELKSIDELYDIKLADTSPASLLSDIYRLSPKGLIIHYDDLSPDAIETINSVLAIAYVPSLVIYFDKTLKSQASHILNATGVYQEDLGLLLPTLLKQMITFSNNYTNLSNTYDTHISMYEESRNLLPSYLKSPNTNDSAYFRTYFNNVFNDSPFISNSPNKVFLLVDHSNDLTPRTECIMVKNADQDLNEQNLALNFSIHSFLEKSRDTGFFVNFHEKNLSDVEDLREIIPLVILDYIQPKTNIAVTAIDHVLLIASDFNKAITQTDISIMRTFNVFTGFMTNLKTQVSEVQDAFYYTMDALARAAESKDDVTGHHIKRVNTFSKNLAIQMGMEDSFVAEIEIAAQMHDVGKIKIPESILNKPGRLTDEEFDIIKSHTLFGEDIIGQSNKLSTAKKIARSHHEKYDGSGYPDRLFGEQIPLEARIVSLADIYDALRSPRSYKEGFSHEKAYDIIVNGDGRVEPHHFDPNVLEAFVVIHETFRQIYNGLKDDDLNKL